VFPAPKVQADDVADDKMVERIMPVVVVFLFQNDGFSKLQPRLRLTAVPFFFFFFWLGIPREENDDDAVLVVLVAYSYANRNSSVPPFF
jgi:hypothetical protein